ncbi:MAG: tyrosine-type recombinase/integrase family protein [Eggerthellaceae bacterium]|nr:tyrosine-type recombinase/integrase family protein [Eggerthellaceae bacterium]
MMRSAKGSITKLGYNHYRIRVEGFADPETGKRRQLSKTIRGTRKQAEDEKLKLLIEAGDEVVDSDMPFGQYVSSMYLPDKEALVASGGKFKRKTLTNYKSRLRNHILPTFENVPLKNITILMIRKWLATIPSKATAKACFAVLSSVLSHAVENLKLRDNPCLKMKPPEVDEYEPEILDLEDIEVYLYFFRETTVEAAVLLAVGGGFRRGEICGLDVADIDFETGATLIDDTYITDGGEAYTETTKTRKKHVVYLPMSITDRLAEILPKHGPVLPGNSNGRMYPDAVTKAYERIQKQMPAEVPRIPLKNLRHSSHTLAYEVGGDMAGIKDRGGWSNMSTPQRYYLRPRGDRDKAIAEAMDAALKPRRSSGRRTITFDARARSAEAF